MMRNGISLKEYLVIFDEAPDPIFITDIEGNFILVNKRFCEITGYSKKELLRMHFLDTYIESEIFLYSKQFSEILTSKQTQVERAIQRKDGGIFYAQIHNKLIDKKWIKGIIRNVSVHKNIEQELYEKEEIFKQITEHIRDVFFLVDVKTNNFLYMSPNYQKIWKKSVKSLLTNPISWMDRIHPKDKTRVIELYQKHLQTGLLDITYRIVLPNRKVRYIHARTFPVYNKKHQIYRIAGVAEDITEYTKIQQEQLTFSEKIRHGFHELVIALSKALEQKDPYTAGHQSNVAYLSAAIAKELNLSKEDLDAIEIAAQIHDIGKIGIPIEILTKPGKITKLEFEIIKKHPEEGYNILKNVAFPWPIAEIVREHHERLDGSGYPRGLKADEITLAAKIIAVADTVDAMSSHRPYRPALGLNAALAEIHKFSGVLFDPEVVKACQKLFLEKRIALYK